MSATLSDLLRGMEEEEAMAELRWRWKPGWFILVVVLCNGTSSLYYRQREEDGSKLTNYALLCLCLSLLEEEDGRRGSEGKKNDG